jgi:addiction module HigA family antidote
MLRSWTIIEAMRAMAKKLPPVHPGEVLREDFLVPMKLAPYTLAKALGVPRTRIERLAREETPVTADTALRLARYFGTTPGFWMGMQAQYDIERAADILARELKRITPAKRTAA